VIPVDRLCQVLTILCDPFQQHETLQQKWQHVSCNNNDGDDG